MRSISTGNSPPSTRVTHDAAVTGSARRPLYQVLRENLRVTDFGVDGGADDTVNWQKAMDFQDTSVDGSFTMEIPDGNWNLGNITIQAGTKLIGNSLEGTSIRPVPGTVGKWFTDQGNAAKIEIYNLTLWGNGEAGITSGIDLGNNGIQWGVYGSMDNVMVRDLPNATGFLLDVNIQTCGRLYTINTKDGLINAPGGVGLHIDAFTPLGFTGVAAQLALHDHIGFMEAEAPGSDNAIILDFKHRAHVDNLIIAIQAGRNVKTPIRFDPVSAVAPLIGKVGLILTGDGSFGNVTTPGDSGTASSAGVGYLEDDTKAWTPGVFAGGAVKITGGTGVGQWMRLKGNSRNRLNTVTAGWVTQPDATSIYQVYYFIEKVGGGGIAIPPSMMARFDDMAVGSLFADTEVRAAKFMAGGANSDFGLTFISRGVIAHDFGNIAAGGFEDVTLTVDGAELGGADTVMVSRPSAIGNAIGFEAWVSAADTVTIRAFNWSAGAGNPGLATYQVVVLRLGT